MPIERPDPAPSTEPKEERSPAEGEWQKLEGFDAATSKFPARARLNQEWILVLAYKDGLRGIERACPHLRASLVDAVLMANATVIRCPQHNFTFRLSDGRGISPPNTRLRVFDIKIEDGVAYGRPAG